MAEGAGIVATGVFDGELVRDDEFVCAGEWVLKRFMGASVSPSLEPSEVIC